MLPGEEGDRDFGWREQQGEPLHGELVGVLSDGLFEEWRQWVLKPES